VLVIGVDGVRFDLLGPAVTPVIWGFGSAGFLGPVPVDETTPTWSGPCWATIATGTGVDGHGITFNDLDRPPAGRAPRFRDRGHPRGTAHAARGQRLAAAGPGRDGGPLFAEAARREFVGRSVI
jgi:hypothetical protein